MDKDDTPSNLFHLAALTGIAATPDEEWNRKASEWLRLDALQRANLQFGPMGRASKAYDLLKIRLEAKYGPGWRSEPPAQAQLRPLYDLVSAEEEEIAREYFNPTSAAAATLAAHPAPTLAAALFKIELIKREDLDDDDTMPVAPWEIVKADLARFAPEAGQ